MKPLILKDYQVRRALVGPLLIVEAMKPQPESVDLQTGKIVPFNGTSDFLLSQTPCPCPPGSEWWVKERWGFLWEGAAKWLADSAKGETKIAYEASGDRAYRDCFDTARSMKRAYSRLTLRVASVEARRVQTITEAEAEATGALRERDTTVADFTAGILPPLSHVCGFRFAWNACHKGPALQWAANPYCWFRVMEAVK